MKKIKFLMLHLRHGGVEKQTIALANYASKYYDVELQVVYKYEEGPAYPVDERVKITYLSNMTPNKEAFKKAVKQKKILRILQEGCRAIGILARKNRVVIRAIQEGNCDVFFSTRSEYAKYLSKYASSSITTISQEHNHIDDESYGKKIKKYCRGIDYLIVMSNLSRELYEKWLQGNTRTKICVIPNAIDIVVDKVSSKKNKTIIASGRFHPVKDFVSLLKMFAQLHTVQPEVKLLLMGDGEQRQILENIVEEYNLQKSVTFTGMVDASQVNDYLLQSDMFIMTSIHECFPMVILEANACGLPVVSFAIPAGPICMIEDGVTGYLIPNRDIAQMANKIDFLYKHPDVLQTLGENAKKQVIQYTMDEVFPLWEEVFNKEK